MSYDDEAQVRVESPTGAPMTFVVGDSLLVVADASSTDAEYAVVGWHWTTDSGWWRLCD